MSSSLGADDAQHWCGDFGDLPGDEVLGTKPISKYEGEKNKDHVRHGKGTYTYGLSGFYTAGFQYTGEWKEGVRIRYFKIEIMHH